MNKKSKTALIVIIGIIISIVVSSIVCSGLLKSWVTDESELQDSYQNKIEKRERIQEIADEVIIEGSGIAIEKIDTEEIGYVVSDNGENIKFYYYLKGENNVNVHKERIYKATIILSKDYKIIEEDYSMLAENIEPFEKYAQQSKISINMLITLLWIAACLLVFLILYVTYYLVLIFITVYKVNKEKQHE